MKPLDRLSEYLGAVERRLRLLTLTRGAAVTAAAALGLTVLAVLVANNFAFSNPSVIGARVFLFLGLAFALGAALIVPLFRSTDPDALALPPLVEPALVKVLRVVANCR